MDRSSNTGRHSFPTISYATNFLFPSITLPIGSFNCCALDGHSGMGASVLGTAGVLVSGGSGFGGALYAGGGGGSCSSFILFAS